MRRVPPRINLTVATVSTYTKCFPQRGERPLDPFAQLQAILADHYLIERELGHGGMSTVFLARDLRYDREVALKVLRPELAAGVGPDRFLSEIRLTAKLHHPHILPLLDSGTAGGVLFYVLPYVRGHSLRQRLRQDRQLPVDEALRITQQVASALDYAHEQGVIHRDIKPDNILLHEGEAMVMDFGIALALDEARGERLTDTGLSLGTPEYMSPEQSSGEREVDARSDVYSLAVVTYEMLTGEPPFTGPTFQSIVSKKATQRPTPPRVLRAGIPEAVESAILKGLANSRADRYRTTSEFAAALTAPPEPSSFARPGRPRLLLGLLIAIAAVALLWRSRALGVVGPLGSQLTALADLPLESQRIAVLYFHVEGGDSNLELVANGLTEGLIDSLKSVKALHVVSGAGVAPFRRGSATPGSIARVLGVGSLVSGTVERVGDLFRISLRLVDGSSGITSIPRTFEGSLQDLPPMQGAMARDVVVMLQAKPRSTGAVGAGAGRAWILVQRAREAKLHGDSLAGLHDSVGAKREYGRADSLAGLASTEDPARPDALVLRGAIAASLVQIVGWDPRLAATILTRGIGFVEQALALDSMDAAARFQRGELLYWRMVRGVAADTVNANWADPAYESQLLDAAQAELEIAVRINPSEARAWALLTSVYAQTKGPSDIARAARRAYDADQYARSINAVIYRGFSSSYAMAQFDDAKWWCNEGQRRLPANSGFAECRLRLLASRAEPPDVARAWRLHDSVSVLSPAGREREFRALWAQVVAAAVIARAGLPDSAREVALRVRRAGLFGGMVSEDVAYVYLLVGDTTAAFKELESGVWSHPLPWQLNMIRAESADWRFKALVGDPRWPKMPPRSATVVAGEPCLAWRSSGRGC